MSSKKTLLTTTIIVGLMIIGAGLGIVSNRFYQTTPSTESIEGLLWPNSKQIGEFSTVDHMGKEFGLTNLQGKWSFLFFGYTHCPDVCPITMSVMQEFHKRQSKANLETEIQTLFITVDPERDTTARLAEYIGYYNGNFSGLGGTADQVDSLASQIGIAYNHAHPEPDGNYLVAHTSSLFLLDPEARLVAIFSAPHSVDTIEPRFLKIENFLRSQD